MGITAAGVAAAASVASAGSSIIGGIVGKGGASSAGGVAKDQQAQTRADLLPYNQAGQAVLPDLQALVMSGPTGGGPDYVTQASGQRPGQMTQAELEQTPGYQWNLAQGLKATQSAAAARGLGVSGASLKGAATYATGLADNTYQNQFNNAQTRFADLLSLNTGQQANLQNQYTRLAGVATIGENAANQTGVQGTLGAALQGNALIQGSQAQGAGLAGAGNALAGGANNLLSNQAYQNAQGTSGYVTGNQNNWDMLPAGGFNTSGNTWYN